MPRVSGVEVLREAFEAGYAVPAINVANMETAQAVLRAADGCGSPVMLQISPGAIAYAGYDTIRQIAFAEAERASVSVVVHLDHCRDPEIVRQALADGFGSVMFDGSRLPWDENVAVTRAIVVEATAAGAAVEGELGIIGGSEDTTMAEAKAMLTSPAEAADFVAATGIHVLAAAIGTLHRMPDDSVELDADAVRAISHACGRPLALHGGSGVRRSQLPQLVECGIGKVNVSSRVSRSLAAGIRLAWKTDAGQSDLRRYLGSGRDEVRHLAEEYMRLCRSAGRSVARDLEPVDLLDEPE
jgi:tagatose 1,6-diphosphate aldolase GatY/KbaY